MRWKPSRVNVDEWLRAAFSERGGGVSETYGGQSLNLGWSEADDAACVRENRRRLIAEAWGDGEGLPELVTAVQVHSADVVVVRGVEARARTDAEGRTRLRGDGLMTDEPGLLLGMQTADCVPVLVADVRRRAVAAFHAGWRGTVERIVERGVAAMAREYGSQPEDLVAAVGPAIGVCCYAVGEEVRERFGAEFRYSGELFAARNEAPQWEQQEAGSGTAGEERMYLDLHEANRRQLVEAGLGAERIEVMRGECTACARDERGERRYFSYRAEHGRTGRMMGVIGVAGPASR